MEDRICLLVTVRTLKSKIYITITDQLPSVNFFIFIHDKIKVKYDIIYQSFVSSLQKGIAVLSLLSPFICPCCP